MRLIDRIIDKSQVAISAIVEKVFSCQLRKKLNNHNFSIICSNCIGGIIYNRLEEKFLSPTINLWMNQKDFLLFVSNLTEYLEQEIEFIDSAYDYPVGKLSPRGGHSDVVLYFNHAHSCEEAQNDWNRRKCRINAENLYIIMYDRDGITRDDILQLRHIACNNVVVFSESKYPDIPYVFTIQASGKPGGEQYLDKDWFGIRTFEKQFDFVNFLNSKLK